MGSGSGPDWGPLTMRVLGGLAYVLLLSQSQNWVGSGYRSIVSRLTRRCLSMSIYRVEFHRKNRQKSRIVAPVMPQRGNCTGEEP